MARTLVAVTIAAGVLWLLIRLIGDPSRTDALEGLFPLLAVILGVDLLWAVSYTVWPKKVRQLVR